MTELPYRTADVFTDRQFGGNPLAVFPDRARNAQLDAAAMQRIARELNLSETVFVLAPDNPAHTCRLRIFTPGSELPFAGHPTVGAAFVLAHERQFAPEVPEVVFEEGIGPVPVRLRAEGGRLTYAELVNRSTPEFRHDVPSPVRLATLLGLDEDHLVDCVAGSLGVPFLLVRLTEAALLSRIVFDLGVFQQTVAHDWASMVFAYARRPDGDWQARMFAPGIGIAEDPATGGAASVLAAHLAQAEAAPEGHWQWLLHQGVEMGRPSRLHLQGVKRDGRVVAVHVGGQAVLCSTGTFWLH